MVTAMGREAMEAQCAGGVVEGRVELVSPVDPAAIDAHHHLCAGFATDIHDVMEIWPQLLGIQGGHEVIEDARCPIWDSANDTEQHALRHTTPRTIVQPCLAFEGRLALDLAVAQGPCGQARALGAAPPAQPGQGTAPQDRFIVVQYNALAPASAREASARSAGVGSSRPVGRQEVRVVFFIHRGRAHGRRGPRTVGRTPWPMCGSSIGQRGRHAARGLDRPGDCGALPVRRSL